MPRSTAWSDEVSGPQDRGTGDALSEGRLEVLRELPLSADDGVYVHDGLLLVVNRESVRWFSPETGALVAETRFPTQPARVLGFSASEALLYTQKANTLREVWSLRERRLLSLGSSELPTVDESDFFPQGLDSPSWDPADSRATGSAAPWLLGPRGTEACIAPSVDIRQQAVCLGEASLVSNAVPALEVQRADGTTLFTYDHFPAADLLFHHGGVYEISADGLVARRGSVTRLLARLPYRCSETHDWLGLGLLLRWNCASPEQPTLTAHALNNGRFLWNLALEPQDFRGVLREVHPDWLLLSAGILNLSTGKIGLPEAMLPAAAWHLHTAQGERIATVLSTQRLVLFRVRPNLPPRQVSIRGCLEPRPPTEALVRVGTKDVMTVDGCFSVRHRLNGHLAVAVWDESHWPRLPQGYLLRYGTGRASVLDDGASNTFTLTLHPENGYRDEE